MADLEIYRSRHFGYIRPASEAGKRFIHQKFSHDEIMTDDIVQFNLDYFEDIVSALQEEAEGLDVEVK